MLFVACNCSYLLYLYVVFFCFCCSYCCMLHVLGDTAEKKFFELMQSSLKSLTITTSITDDMLILSPFLHTDYVDVFTHWSIILLYWYKYSCSISTAGSEQLHCSCSLLSDYVTKPSAGGLWICGVPKKGIGFLHVLFIILWHFLGLWSLYVTRSDMWFVAFHFSDFESS